MKVLKPVLFVLLCMFSTLGVASDQTTNLTGRWLITADFYGTTRYMQMKLEQKGSAITGKVQGSDVSGSLDGTRLHLTAQNNGGTQEFTATVEAGRKMTGTAVFLDTEERVPATVQFTGVLVPGLQARGVQKHDFTPTVFYRQFSPFTKPVLTVAPGDTIHTTTVDAGGNDDKGVERVAGGNPQTGPFYIDGAMPGDTLVVHFTRVRTNRDWAASDDGIVESGLNSNLAVKMKDNGKTVRWNIDAAKGVASIATASEHLANFSVPLRPMLGCVAVATPPGLAPPHTGDSGFFGGNMDFNEIGEGATVYLPVLNPGALLYVGDGHALQGDGELNGNALETSMDVEFTVNVIQDKRTPFVRVETPTAIVAMGLSGSLDDAFKDATASMSNWLAEDYQLSASEIAKVLGATAQYRVSEVADRNSGIVLKISKERLATITRKH